MEMVWKPVIGCGVCNGITGLVYVKPFAQLGAFDWPLLQPPHADELLAGPNDESFDGFRQTDPRWLFMLARISKFWSALSFPVWIII
jgi:hypothetical protein